MQILVTIARILVGLLFIFSGLVKANDPLGLSYKMQEFFEVWGIHGFNSWTTTLSVLMNAFEIIAGFALLLGWRIRLFIWLLLLLILFFTFLTGYTYVTGKPVNCGCFGDCIPISSKTSFLKDVALTILIAFLFTRQKRIKPLWNARVSTALMGLVTLLGFGLQWYTLNYLPVVDCLPYKKGNNISEQMKMPANAVPDSTVITFVYEKNGQPVEFTATDFPADFNTRDYKLVSRYDKVVRKGKNNQPPISGFSLSGPTDTDSTQEVLSHPFAVLLFCEDFSTPLSAWKEDFETIYVRARSKNIPVYLVTARPGEARTVIATTGFAGIPVFKCDYKAIATAARTNPCLYLLEKGTVTGKWSYRTMENALDLLEKIPQQTAPVPVIPADTTSAAMDTLNREP